MTPSHFMHVPIVIVCRDRLMPLKRLLAWLEAAGYSRPLLVDNASTFPPLVDFLDSQDDVEVIRLDRNLYELAPWRSDTVQAALPSLKPFVVTDCDVVPDDQCPTDVVEHLATVLDSYTGIDKVGLGLRIDDLPDCYTLKHEVIEWESQFWERELAPNVFHAAVDTTFALYRSPTIPHSVGRALRTGSPYVARHLPWYTNSSRPTDEQRYYCEHTDAATSDRVWPLSSAERTTLRKQLAAKRTVLRQMRDEEQVADSLCKPPATLRSALHPQPTKRRSTNEQQGPELHLRRD